MHRVAVHDRAGEERQPEKDQQVNRQAGGQDSLADFQQPVRTGIRAQAAPQVQPQPAAELPVRPGQENHKQRHHQGDQQIGEGAVRVKFGNHLRRFPSSFRGGSRKETAVFRGSSTGRPLR